MLMFLQGLYHYVFLIANCDGKESKVCISLWVGEVPCSSWSFARFFLNPSVNWWHCPQKFIICNSSLLLTSGIGMNRIDVLFFIYLFLAALGLLCCTWAFSSCSERGLLFVAVCRLLMWWLLLLWSMGSRCVGFTSCGSRALEHRLSSCGARA